MHDLDLDPLDGQMVPCVVCMMSPQRGGTGCCSRECLLALELWAACDK